MDSNFTTYDADFFEKTKSGLPKTMHGNFYQTKLCMWYLIRFLNKGSEFQLSSEWDEAGKFNDLVVRCFCDNDEVMIFLQAKHKSDDTKSVPWFSKTEFCNYFVSYLEIMKKGEFKGTNKSFILCTNIDITNLMEQDFKNISIAENDLIVTDSYQYQFSDNSSFKNKLVEKFERITDRELSDNKVLAETLVQNLNKTIKAADHEMLVKFKKFLCNIVFETKKDDHCLIFRKNFINKKNLDRSALTFHSCLVEALSAQNLAIDQLNSCFIYTKDKYFTSSEQKLKNSEIPGDQVNSKYIGNFFDRFIFMVTPNEEQLDESIRNDLLKCYGSTENAMNEAISANAFKIFFYEILDWLKKTKVTQINRTKGQEIVEIIKKELIMIVPPNEQESQAELQNRWKEVSYLSRKLNEVNLALLQNFVFSQNCSM